METGLPKVKGLPKEMDLLTQLVKMKDLGMETSKLKQKEKGLVL